MTILGLSVSMLIPVVGYMVIIGYLLYHFAREREGHAAEDFDFNFFGDYLQMGLWPTLATMLFSLLIVPFVFVFAILPVFMIPLLENGQEDMIILVAVGAFLAYCALLAIFTVFLYPVLLRSGLMIDFKAGFSWSFMKSFAAKVGLSLLGWFLLLALISIPLMLVGFFALFVGVYVVAAWPPGCMSPCCTLFFSTTT